jgi:hypothetical protein
MISIFEAANTVEAHMILNLLEQAGLTGRIEDEYLQGGMGEIPAVGIIRVMILESDFEAAKKIVDEWDALMLAARCREQLPRRPGGDQQGTRPPGPECQCTGT